MAHPIICELNQGLLKTDLRSELLVNQFKAWVQKALIARFDAKQRRFVTKEEAPAHTVRLPFNQPVLDFLIARRAAGQRVILVADNTTVDQSGLSEMEVYDDIVDRRDVPSLIEKLDSFEFIGNARSVDSLWSRASKRYAVENNNRVADKVGAMGLTLEQVFPAGTGLNFKTISRTLRCHQWLKNILVFVPLITAQQLDNRQSLLNALLMFVCFGLVASAGYIINDLLDLQSDRVHPEKQTRPFASGDLSAGTGVLIGLGLLALSTLIASYLPINAGLTLVAYFFLTILYSIYLKTKVMMDVVVLGTLFMLRVLGGAEAIGTELSFYLMSFSIFLFASLGMVKRYAELHNLKKRDKLSARGRGYQVDDMAPVRIIGISMGYMSVFILGQYINSPVVTEYYRSPKLIWLLFPLLMFWLGRLWILANRGEVNEDPLIFTVKDRTSQLVFLVSATILYAAN